jgi:hypothetical protein
VLSDTELLIWSHVLQTAVVQMLEKQMGPEPFRKVYVWSTLCLIEVADICLLENHCCLQPCSAFPSFSSCVELEM